jgi:putative transposase
MRKKREFVDGAIYHVTSRTNDKKRVFECNVGRKTMLLVLKDAREKFGFTLANYGSKPIRPNAGTVYMVPQTICGARAILPVLLKILGTIFS